MASFTYDVPADLERQLEALERAAGDESIRRILAAGGKQIEEEMKSQCQSHKQSGRMVNSIKTTKAKKNDKGYYVVTRPTGKEVRKGKDGKVHTVRNMEKLVYLHFGTRKQQATGIVTKVINRSEVPAVKAMQEVFNGEVIR